jgi:hypothetical protein
VHVCDVWEFGTRFEVRGSRLPEEAKRSLKKNAFFFSGAEPFLSLVSSSFSHQIILVY